jgi:hypothetical protein
MRRIMLALTILAFLASAPAAMARGNHRSALDLKWKAVQAWQKKQDERFKAIERDAARGIQSLRTQPGIGELAH